MLATSIASTLKKIPHAQMKKPKSFRHPTHSLDLQVALHFVELYFDGEQQRLFDVQIHANGQMSNVLTNFDIYKETGELSHKPVLMATIKSLLIYSTLMLIKASLGSGFDVDEVFDSVYKTPIYIMQVASILHTHMRTPLL